MQSLIKKLPKFLQFALVVLLILLGGFLLAWSQIKRYQLTVNGESISMRAVAFYPRDLFEMAGINLQPEDALSLDPDAFSLDLPEHIWLTSARPATIDTPDGKTELHTPTLFPATILLEAGIKIFPEDILLVDGEIANPDQKLPPGEQVNLEFIPAKQINVIIDKQHHTTLFTQTLTYEQALEEAGLEFDPKDHFNPDLDQQLAASNELTVTKAKPVCATSTESQHCGLSAAVTVAEALVDLGVTLQHLNYAQPTDDQPVPPNRSISLHSVEERLVLQTDETSFAYTYQEDPNTQLDSTSVIVPGQPGIEVVRLHERIEDGNIVTTTSEGPWKASDPRDGIMGRGTRAVLQTETVDGQTIEFWRKVSVYATSYHPSIFGDNPRTRSGLPLQKGTVAVSAAWYPSMALQPVYVQGYGFGTVGDSGYGIPGTYWIDLGYSDEDYVGWHSWTTLYLLPPIPAWYPAVLP